MAARVAHPDADVLGAGRRAGAVPAVHAAGGVALQQLPAARTLPPRPELIARVGAAGGRGGKSDLGAGHLRPQPSGGFRHRGAVHGPHPGGDASEDTVTVPVRTIGTLAETGPDR